MPKIPGDAVLFPYPRPGDSGPQPAPPLPTPPVRTEQGLRTLTRFIEAMRDELHHRYEGIAKRQDTMDKDLSSAHDRIRAVQTEHQLLAASHDKLDEKLGFLTRRVNEILETQTVLRVKSFTTGSLPGLMMPWTLKLTKGESSQVQILDDGYENKTMSLLLFDREGDYHARSLTVHECEQLGTALLAASHTLRSTK